MSLAAISFLAFATLVGADQSSTGAKSRTFLFTYEATVTGLKPGTAARIWLPHPPTNDDQVVSLVQRDLPSIPKHCKEAKFANEIFYLEPRADAAGRIRLALTYRVRRSEVKASLRAAEDAAKNLERFLQPDALVPVGGRCLELLKDEVVPRDPTVAARLFYEVTNRHLRYSKEGTGWGRGDTDWACASGYGNCSDFHSLFISLARAHRIPAKFEIGFPLPEKRGKGEVAGYHCWAWFHAEPRGWAPVDISDASKNPQKKAYNFGNLSEDRVLFSVGRDLTLAPPQDGPQLNFFIYPYVEVAGQPYPADRVERRFTFTDVDE
jgi:transglutaminase-like putative cysteine protease